MNKFLKLTTAVLLICFSLCGCAKEENDLNSVLAEGTSDISNNAGESYTVNYTVKNGLHHNSLSVKIFSDNELIGFYSGNADRLAVPEKIVKLCEDCYYFADDTDCGVIVGGLPVPDDELSETLREKMTREELSEKLENCGYSAKDILKCYDEIYEVAMDSTGR